MKILHSTQNVNKQNQIVTECQKIMKTSQNTSWNAITKLNENMTEPLT